METIKVNMTPCDDIKTIHASQNDNEARQWGFELHNNGEKIDSSSISDQLVFKAYEGGTEEILPTNGSTPTTSPFLGDIKYPQGLLSDQEFLYRESPTEEDGLAKITDVKGNTLVWNQLVPTNAWATSTNNGITWTSNGDGSYTVSNTSTGASFPTRNVEFKPTLNHKYLVTGCLENSGIRLTFNGASWFTDTTGIFEYTNALPNPYFIMYVPSTGRTINTIVRPQVFDLTLMGLDSITSVDDFTALFPKPYYDYNKNTLLSFNGTGIKTTGKNFVNVDLELLKVRNSLGTWNGNEYTYQGVTFKVNFTSQGYIDSVVVNGTATANANLNLMRLLRPSTFFNKPITMSGCPSGGSSSKYRMTLQMQTSPYTTVGHDYGNGLNATIPDNGEDYQAIIRIISGYTCDNVVFRPMITFQGVDQTFEPYTSSTLSLPISTYFPSGMKSAGNVYDELTESKAITRIGSVDLGSLTWQYGGTLRYFYVTISDLKDSTQNALCDKYANSMASSISQVNDKQFMIYSNEFRVKDSAYTDAATFKTAMSGVYLYYELGTYQETSFITASLVTENAEIPLSNEDGTLIGKCTEQLSSESGFIDAKIKLTDEDGECYSNKIQLHVERKPS